MLHTLSTGASGLAGAAAGAQQGRLQCGGPQVACVWGTNRLASVASHRNRLQTSRARWASPAGLAVSASAQASSEQAAGTRSAGEMSWKGHRISYERFGAAQKTKSGDEKSPGKEPVVVIVHGFGSNSAHFADFATRLATRTGLEVICPDLIGFGESEKPEGLTYNPYTWRDLVVDFIGENVEASRPVILIGNSIGSQVALMTAAQLKEQVLGTFLINCAGGMNAKGLYDDDFLLRLLSPVFGLVELLLQSPYARGVFDRFRSAQNVRDVLEKQVYVNKDRVTDDLVRSLMKPSDDPGALGVFVQVYTGDPGPRPEKVAPEVTGPIALAWGLDDKWTPANGTVANFFRRLAETQPDKCMFYDLPGCGHVPFDDSPDEVLDKALTPWLSEVLRVVPPRPKDEPFWAGSE